MKRVLYLTIAATALAAAGGCSSNWCSRGAPCAPCAPYGTAAAMPAGGGYLTTPTIGVTQGTTTMIAPGPDTYTPTTPSP